MSEQRDVLITREQAELVAAAQAQLGAAQRQLNLICDAILRGHGIKRAQVVKLDADMHTLTIVEAGEDPQIDVTADREPGASDE